MAQRCGAARYEQAIVLTANAVERVELERRLGAQNGTIFRGLSKTPSLLRRPVENSNDPSHRDPKEKA